MLAWQRPARHSQPPGGALAAPGHPPAMGFEALQPRFKRQGVVAAVPLRVGCTPELIRKLAVQQIGKILEDVVLHRHPEVLAANPFPDPAKVLRLIRRTPHRRIGSSRWRFRLLDRHHRRLLATPCPYVDLYV